MLTFKDLETKGFIVIKNFLSNNALETLRQDYQKQKDLLNSNSAENKNYALVGSTYDFRRWINPIVNTISQNTNLSIDCVMTGAAYFDNQLINFPWHQDHECYYQWQDMYNAINCWIPIIKPNYDQSGISIIPHDNWINKCPEIFVNHILGKGAKHFVKLNNGTTDMHDDDLGGHINLPFDIDELAVTPNLNAGDALILRQDIIHQTQDNINNRVAISIRCRNSNGILTKSKLLNSCDRKNEMIKNNRQWYDQFIEKFENTDQLIVKDIIELNQ